MHDKLHIFERQTAQQNVIFKIIRKEGTFLYHRLVMLYYYVQPNGGFTVSPQHSTRTRTHCTWILTSFVLMRLKIVSLKNKYAWKIQRDFIALIFQVWSKWFGSKTSQHETIVWQTEVKIHVSQLWFQGHRSSHKSFCFGTMTPSSRCHHSQNLNHWN